MKPSARLYWLFLLSGSALASGACTPFGVRPPSDQPAAFKDCGPDGVIDDLEDNNTQISVFDDRGGYWYTYADKAGSSIVPEQGDKGGTFTMAEGGNGSKYAVNFKGKLASGSVVYAAAGLNFRDPKEAFDASKYAGITFFAKRNPTSTSQLLVKIPDGNTDPDGGICSACYNDFATELTVGTDWKRYVLPFRSFRQEGSWGAPRKPHLDVTKLFAVHWETKASGADFDFWIDDIAFVCKG